MDRIKVFSPGSVTNLSCGYDILGFCLDKVGDTITITKTPEKGIIISSIDKYDLPTSIDENVAGIAAQAMMNEVSIDYGIDIKIEKGIKPGSGIGSSAASSAGVVYAINKLIGSPFTNLQLIRFAMEGEKYVSGSYHADNVSPILLGGFTLVRSIEELDIIKLPNPKDLIATIIRPEIELKTSDSRKVVKSKVTIDKMVRQSANLAAFISSLYTEDYELMSSSIVDEIIEPDRALLIPEYYNIKEISTKAGAIACGISGSGPAIFSLSKSSEVANDILNKISSHFDSVNITYNGFVSIINSEGVKVID
jgi:homoserine kinase